MTVVHQLSARRTITPGQYFAMPMMEQKFMVASVTAELEAEDAEIKKIEAMRNG